MESPESVTGGGDPDVGVTGGQAFDRVWDGVREPRSILVAHETKFQSCDLAPLNKRVHPAVCLSKAVSRPIPYYQGIEKPQSDLLDCVSLD